MTQSAVHRAEGGVRILLSSHGASLFGAERVLLALADGLAGRGHDVTLEFPIEGPALEVAHRIDGVRVWRSGRPRLPRNVLEFIRYILGVPRAIWHLAGRIRREAYDVVWVNSLFNPLAAIAARFSGATVIWHVHERNFPGIAGWLYSRLIGGLCNVAVAVSEFVAGTLRVPEGKIYIMPNALLQDVMSSPLRTGQGRYTVGYVGQLEPRKRVMDLLNAIARLPDTCALVVGDGKGRRETERAIERLGLRDRLKLVGFQRDVRPYFPQFDCVVIPSSNEPFGLVALEAMAAGRPVVAAQSGALPEVLGDAALFYALGNIADMAAQIDRLRTDVELAGQLRARGLRRVEAFSFGRLIDHAERIIREAMASTPDSASDCGSGALQHEAEL